MALRLLGKTFKPKNLGFCGGVTAARNHSVKSGRRHPPPSSSSSSSSPRYVRYAVDPRVLEEFPSLGDCVYELPEGMDPDPKVFASFLYGGISPFYGPLTDPDVVETARSAVQLYNKQQNAKLKFVRVLKAFQQVVCGFKFYLTLEAIDAGVKNKYKAEIVRGPVKKYTLESFHLVET